MLYGRYDPKTDRDLDDFNFCLDHFDKKLNYVLRLWS